MEYLPVLRNPVPETGRNITSMEFTRLSIRGVGCKRNARISPREDGTMFIQDTAGREHRIGYRAN